MPKLSTLIEALLFREAGPMTVDELAESLGATPTDIETALAELENKLQDRGVVLSRSGESLELRTAALAAKYIQKLEKESGERELGRAGLETLAAVLYRAPVSRAEVNHLRGVNSSAALRTLLIRGLIEPVEKSGRTLYQPTTDALGYIGLKKSIDAPDYETFRQALSVEHAED